MGKSCPPFRLALGCIRLYFLGDTWHTTACHMLLYLRDEAPGGPGRLGRKWWEYLSGHIRNCLGLANPPDQAGDVDDIPVALPQVGEGELGR